MEGGVGGVEDAATEDDLHRLVAQVEPDDGGADERGDLVGQEVGCLAGGCIAVGGGVEEDPGQLEEPGVGERAAVDARERCLGVGRAELRGAPARAGWWPGPGRRRHVARGPGRGARARRRRAQSLRRARPGRGSARSGRRGRRRRSSSPCHRRPRCPRTTWCRPVRRRTCRCAGSRGPSTRVRRSPAPASPRRSGDRCRPSSRPRSDRAGTRKRAHARQR